MENFFIVYVLIFSVLELRYTSGLMPPDVFTQTIRMPDAVSDKVRSSRCVIDTIVFRVLILSIYRNACRTPCLRQSCFKVGEAISFSTNLASNPRDRGKQPAV